METWKKKRLKGIGGSDSSAILGLNKYMTNVDLWKIKTGRKQQEDISNKEVVKYGVAMEPILINMFAVDNPQYEVNHKDFDLRYHQDYSFLFGSLDGTLIEKETNKHGVLEIKTCQLNSFNYKDWKDKIPDNYYCQVLHYLLCTGFDFAIVFALLKHKENIEIKKYEIQRKDVEEEINFLLEKELEFWNEYVLKDKEPPLILPQI